MLGKYGDVNFEYSYLILYPDSTGVRCDLQLEDPMRNFGLPIRVNLGEPFKIARIAKNIYGKVQ